MPKSMWIFDPSNLGNNAISLNGIRLLVVAESHYRERRDHSDFHRHETQKIVEEHGFGLTSSTSRSSLFRKLADVLAVDGIEGADVWRNIYFYNYFQRVMDNPSDPPTAQDYADAAAPFDALLRELKPDAILVVSGRVWEFMQNECTRAGDCALGAVYDFTAGIEMKIPGAHTLHPSAPFRSFEITDWRPRVQDFLRYARARKITP